MCTYNKKVTRWTCTVHNNIEYFLQEHYRKQISQDTKSSLLFKDKYFVALRMKKKNKVNKLRKRTAIKISKENKNVSINHCPIISVTFAYTFHTLNVTVIMWQK